MKKGLEFEKKWLNAIEDGMKIAGLCVDDVEDRVKWRSRTLVAELKKFVEMRGSRRIRRKRLV